MAAARFWRVVGLVARGGGSIQLSALHLHGAAGRLDGAAALTSTHAPAEGALSALQDDDVATSCTFSAASVRAPGFALVWDFGGSPVDVTGLRFGSGDSAATFVAAGFILQGSDDGAQWVTALSAITASRAIWPGARAMTGLIKPGWQEVWAESFDAGIPSGFASTLTDAGTLVVTHDPANGAVIMDATGYNTAWMFSLPAAAISVRLEFDVEIITPSYGNAPEIGMALVGGPQLLQCRIPIGSAGVASTSSNTAGGLGLSTTRASGTLPAASPTSGRAIWAFSSAPDAGGVGRDYGFSAGGGEITLNHSQTPATAILKAGIFLRSCRIRLHGVRGLARGLEGAEAMPSGTVAQALERYFHQPLEPFATALAQGARLARDVEFGGPGRVWGINEIEVAPGVRVPTGGRVVLLRQRDKLLARETWADRTTGAWSFEGLDTRQDFIVLAEDLAGNYRPVAANRLTPEAP